MGKWLVAVVVAGIAVYLGLGDWDLDQKFTMALLPLTAAAAILLLSNN
jgi:type IV secretory pathway VirB2 component (pilin)